MNRGKVFMMTRLNRFASIKHTCSYGDVIYPGKEVLQVSNTWKFRKESVTKESSMKSDSINRLILEYLGTEDRK